ncbi:N-acetyltransferase [Massilia sp. erpn]|nr:N-acetyltransferase [Massilia sp. erpn]
MNMMIRKECAEDIDAITTLTKLAFECEEHSSHTEQFIVNALRRSAQLSVSLVAVENKRIIGHVAISPVTVSSGAGGWFGLGPISVEPDHQGRGIGSALIKTALAELQLLGGVGCVVLGDPAYYGRFGFQTRPGLTLAGISPEYFQALSFGAELPVGIVQYHTAFDAVE